MATNKKYEWRILGLFLAIVIMIPLIVWASSSINVPSNSKGYGMNSTGDYVTVTNLSSKAYFVPMKTLSEWSSFFTYAPNYVSVSICGDGYCTNGETGHCGADCGSSANYVGYCGDGVCSDDGLVVSDDGESVSQGENCSNCAIDCGLCTNASCGVCGVNGNGAVCDNKCGTGSSGTPDCVKLNSNSSRAIGGSFIYTCGWNTADLCPAGYYCPYYGAGADISYACPAGFYCPIGSGKPKICLPGTYSTGKASSCTPCPNGEGSPAMSNTESNCVAPKNVCGNGTCETGETPLNCPQDCQISGDGRCTGKENYQNDPTECKCGNGVCDNNETYLSCQTDCHYCGDGVCYAATENHSNCPSDCKCGDGVCNASIGETHASCPSDCKCGDGVCDASIGETASTCPADCGSRCGDGICNVSAGENYDNCPDDCNNYCGDGVCQSKEVGDCLEDCGNTCGDGVCESNENSKDCPADCY